MSITLLRARGPCSWDTESTHDQEDPFMLHALRLTGEAGPTLVQGSVARRARAASQAVKEASRLGAEESALFGARDDAKRARASSMMPKKTATLSPTAPPAQPEGPALALLRRPHFAQALFVASAASSAGLSDGLSSTRSSPTASEAAASARPSSLALLKAELPAGMRVLALLEEEFLMAA